jgi:hypothetical protein
MVLSIDINAGKYGSSGANVMKIPRKITAVILTLLFLGLK